MKKKKILAVLLATSMALSVATGCEKAASYDDIYDEVVEDVKKEYKKELKKDLEDELREELTSEIEDQLYDQIYEEIKGQNEEELKQQLEEAQASMREELEAELRPTIEASVREELEKEYNDKLQEAINELNANAGGEGGEGGEGGQGPAGEAGYVEGVVDFDVNNFEFDKKHMVANGQPITFGSTLCKNLPDEFFGAFIGEDDRATYYLNEKKITWISCQLANHTGKADYSAYESCAISFVNLDYDGPLLLSDCYLYEVEIASKASKGRTLVDDGLTFDIGSGLTETSTYEDFVAVLGEPNHEYSYEYDNGTSTTEYTFGSTYSQGWSIKVEFVDDKGISSIDFTGYVYAD